MPKTTLDDALCALGRADPTFNKEIRKRLAGARSCLYERVFRRIRPSEGWASRNPAYLIEPDLKRVAIELAEFALEHGIDVNLPCEEDGRTLLHDFVLVRDSAIAVEAVTWLLAHGADPNRPSDDGETPYRLAVRYRRKEVAEVMCAHGAH